jgi:cytochrome P450
MPSFLTITGALAGAYFLTFIYRLINNYILAWQTGFPIVIVPWDQNHFFWMILGPVLRPLLRTYLPKSIYDRIVITTYGWEFWEGKRPYTEYAAPQGNAKSFMLVTCGRTEFETCDPEIALEILRRPMDFQIPDLTGFFMGRFGHNVLTTNGERWARQRKVVAAVINERISKAVFHESIRQTDGLLKEVYRAAPEAATSVNTTGIFDMIKKVTIHVLSGAGMGASVPFNNDANEKPKPGFKMTYIEAVKIVTNNVAGPIILPQWFLDNYPSFLPGHQLMKSLGEAIQEFPAHTNDLLNEEKRRSAVSKENDTRNNIMSQLLRASEAGEKGNALTDEEMMGNLFIFTAAGFDTTANSKHSILILPDDMTFTDHPISPPTQL